MLDLDTIIENLTQVYALLKVKLDNRRLDMVDQDGPMQSIGITATRWAVEQEINSMDDEMARLETGIKELKKLKKEKIRYYDKYFVSDKFEYLSLGIISKETELGKNILERNINRGKTR